MSQILDLLNNESYKSPVLRGYLQTIRGISDAGGLQCLRHEFSIKLEWRSSEHSTQANPELGNLTVREVRQILEAIFTQMVATLSAAQTALHNMRYID